MLAARGSDARSSAPAALLVCDYFLKYTLGLARGLQQAGCRTTVLGREHAGEFGGDIAAARAEIDRRLAAGGDVRLLPGRVRDVRATRDAVTLRRTLADDGAVVHLQDGVVNDPRLPFVARAMPGRFALTVHDPVAHPGDRPMAFRKRLARTALLRGAAIVFVHGEALADELRAVTGVRRPIEVVPHGSDPPRVAPLPPRPSLLFFGRISAYKGLDVLLEAMPSVWAQVPDARLVIAGEGHLPDHPSLADDRVTVFNEHVAESDVPNLFAGSSAVVLPYRQASQSGVGAQAKAYGRASIVTDVGALPELVADGSGLVVANEQPSALARGAIRLLTDRALAQHLGSVAAGTADSSGGWARVGALTLEAYRRHRLLAAPGRPTSRAGRRRWRSRS